MSLTNDKKDDKLTRVNESFRLRPDFRDAFDERNVLTAREQEQQARIRVKPGRRLLVA